MKQTKKHGKGWFIRRIGEDVILNNYVDLFNVPVKIDSLKHAKALHAHQDKGHRYTDKIKDK